MKQHKKDIEDLLNKILYLEEINNKNTKKYKKKLKLLQHDIYFLKKENAQLVYERNDYKEKQDNILRFVNEYGIKDIYELFDLITLYKKGNKYKKNISMFLQIRITIV